MWSLPLLGTLVLVLALLGVVAAPADAARSRVTLSGTLERIHGHTRTGSVSSWMLTTDSGRRVALRAVKARGLRSGVRVRIRGVRAYGSIRVTSLERLPGARARAAVAPNGARKTAVVMLNFANDRTQPFSADQVRQAMFTGDDSANAFFREESHESLSLVGRDNPNGDVFGWYEIDAAPGDSCGNGDWLSWLDAADAAARTAGASLDGYDHVVYLFPKVAACPWSGMGSLGGDWTVLNGDIGLWLTGHELGHNYGFEHATKLYCTDAAGKRVAISRRCTSGEYDDPYDIMGNRFERWSSLIRQVQAGWISAANVTPVAANATAEIAPLELRTTARQGLRISRGDGRSYWVELRRPAGRFDDFGLGEAVVNGVTIRLGEDRNPALSALIDTNPTGSRRLLDEPLAVGRTFTDFDHGIRVTTDAVSATGATVRVQLGPIPPPPASPPVTGTANPAPTPTPAPSPPTLTPPPTPEPPPAPTPNPIPPPTPSPAPVPPTTLTPAPVPPTTLTPVPPRPPAPPTTGTTTPTNTGGRTPSSPDSTPLPSRPALPVSGRQGALGVAVGRLKAFDGRGLLVGQRGRVQIDLRFRMSSDMLARPARVQLRARSRTGCRAELSTRSRDGKWQRLAQLSTRRAYTTSSVALPAAAVKASLELRVACGGRRQALDIDAVSVTAS